MTLYIRGFDCFVTSTAAPIATGWSDSCRVGISPTERTRLSTAHFDCRVNNWPDVERRTIIACILSNGESPDDVEGAIFKYSPSATSPEKRKAISEDINGIKRIFLDLPMPEIKNNLN